MAQEVKEIPEERSLVAIARYFGRVGLSKRDVEDLVAALEPEMVPYWTARVIALRKLLAAGEKSAEERMAKERILSFGTEWTDTDTGIIHVFKGEPQEWKVSDPDGLHAALTKAKAPKDRIDRAVFKVWKCNHTELNGMREISPEIREIIDDFRGERGYAPAHLKEKE